MHTGYWLVRPRWDAVVTAGVLPALIGMIAGVVYCHLAGREPRRAAMATSADVETPARPQAYDGPLQVRTSFVAIAIAAFVPAVFTATLMLLMVSSMTGEPAFPGRSGALFTLGFSAQALIVTALTTAIPTGIFAAVVHGLARAMERTRSRDYVVIGALTGAAFGTVFLFLNAAIFIWPCVLLGALVAGIYRRFAGLEPKSLPEAVLVRELEALVPADHPTRRAHTVVLNG
jgi:hypothetical protein